MDLKPAVRTHVDSSTTDRKARDSIVPSRDGCLGNDIGKGTDVSAMSRYTYLSTCPHQVEETSQPKTSRVLQPPKRVSDFSTEFLLSENVGPKRKCHDIAQSVVSTSPWKFPHSPQDQCFPLKQMGVTKNAEARHSPMDIPFRTFTQKNELSGFLSASAAQDSVLEQNIKISNDMKSKSSLSVTSNQNDNNIDSIYSTEYSTSVSHTYVYPNYSINALHKGNLPIQEYSESILDEMDRKKSGRIIYIDSGDSITSLRDNSSSTRNSNAMSPVNFVPVFPSFEDRYVFSRQALPQLAAVCATIRGSSTSPAHSDFTASIEDSPTTSPLEDNFSPTSFLLSEKLCCVLPPNGSINTNPCPSSDQLDILPMLSNSMVNRKSIQSPRTSRLGMPYPSFLSPSAAAYFSSIRKSLPHFQHPINACRSTSALSKCVEAVDQQRFEPQIAFITRSKSVSSTPNTHVFHPRLISKPFSPPSNVEVVCRESAEEKETNNSSTNTAEEIMKLSCPDCGKNYSTFSGVRKHRQLHCGYQAFKDFTCKVCNKVYASLGALKMHIRTHTLPCKCAVCGKAFSRPWLLQGHMRTHTGEKPFSCHHCRRAFADRSNLRAHLQTHSDVKRYCCNSCSRTFSRMSLLLKHEGTCTITL